MDVYESEKALEKHKVADTTRPPLAPAEKNNVVTTRRPRTREVSSRYKSPAPAASSGHRRCPSPNITRTISSQSQLLPKRSVSAERKRPSTPPSPRTPSTPVDPSIDSSRSSRRLSTGRLPESLWPSTMRSLSVSFQSDSISVAVSKKEKPANNSSVDRTLRPTLNVLHKHGEMPTISRKPTPERKRSPLKGKNAPDQSENSRPTDSLHSRLIDQHRWPSRVGKTAVNSLSKSFDLSDKTARTVSSPAPGLGLSSLRRGSVSESSAKSLQKAASDGEKLTFNNEIGRLGSTARSSDDSIVRGTGSHKLLSASSLDRSTLASAAARLQSLPAPGSRPASPSRIPSLSSIARGVSPSRVRPSTPPSRGVSPSRIRQTSTSTQSRSANSVLSFIADLRKGKKGASYIEDAHHLRLLYNRYLQWRFANARAEAVMYFQNLTAEETLFNVWNATLNLRDLASSKRICLHQLKLELKLSAILIDQMRHLEEWAELEKDHISSLAGAIGDLQANTLRLPVTAGARADIESLKAAICSALDVMQAMGSSICSLLSQAEGMNSLISLLAVVVAREKAMLEQCEEFLGSTAAMQIEDCSLRIHSIQQTKEPSGNRKPQIVPPKRLPWP